MEELFNLVCKLTWHRNNEARAWGPEHGTIVILPSTAVLQQFVSGEGLRATFIGHMDWRMFHQQGLVPEGLGDVVEHALGFKDASLVMLHIDSPSKCLCAMVPSDPALVFPDDADRFASYEAFKTCPAVENPGAKDMASAYFRVCAGCQKPLNGKKRYTCARCRAVYFCSDACHRGHWPEHKRMCFNIESNR